MRSVFLNLLILMDIAKEYQENEELIAGLDSVYGSGSARYIGEAIESFYTTPSKIIDGTNERFL